MEFLQRQQVAEIFILDFLVFFYGVNDLEKESLKKKMDKYKGEIFTVNLDGREDKNNFKTWQVTYLTEIKLNAEVRAPEGSSNPDVINVSVSINLNKVDELYIECETEKKKSQSLKILYDEFMDDPAVEIAKVGGELFFKFL